LVSIHHIHNFLWRSRRYCWPISFIHYFLFQSSKWVFDHKIWFPLLKHSLDFLATGIVILISMAIAIGIVFFLLLAGVIWTLLMRDTTPLDQKGYFEDDHDSVHRPSSLLEHINAATRSTIIGAGAGAGAVAGRQSTDEHDHAGPSTEGGHTTDGDGWRRSETPAVASGGIVGSGNEPEEEIGRPAFARYSFDGEGEGELALQTGAQLSVLDDRDAAWWYVRDEQTGREGIVPAAYLY
jgi:SH3 domain